MSMSPGKKRRNRNRRNRLRRVAAAQQAGKLSVKDALDMVDEDLPDGAWMACLEEMTGLDAGDIASELARLEEKP